MSKAATLHATGRDVLVPYLRQSRKREDTISIADQRDAIAAWAKREGVRLAPEIVEQDVSGSKDWRSRGVGRAVLACEEGHASGIIVAWQDRLSRENGLATAEVWQALEAAGARLVAVGDGIDTAGGDHEMLFTIKAAIARDQWKRHRTNWQNAQRRANEDGRLIGLAPIGYVKGEDGRLIIDPDTAEAVREIFRMRKAGASWSEIGRALERSGIKTRRGGTTWTQRTLQMIVRNEIYLGVLKRGEDFRREGNHQPLIDRPTWLAAQSMVAGRTSRGNSEGTRLSGIVHCGSCGQRMIASKRSDESKSVYRCYSRIRANGEPCSHPTTISMSKADSFVVGALIDRYRDIQLDDSERPSTRTDLLRRKLQRATDARDGLLGDIESLASLPSDVRTATIAKAQAAVDAVQSEIDAIEVEQVTRFNVWNVDAYFEPGSWKEASVADQRRLIAAGVERVTIHPATNGRHSKIEDRIAVEFPAEPVAEVIDLGEAREAAAS